MLTYYGFRRMGKNCRRMEMEISNCDGSFLENAFLITYYLLPTMGFAEMTISTCEERYLADASLRPIPYASNLFFGKTQI